MLKFSGIRLATSVRTRHRIYRWPGKVRNLGRVMYALVTLFDRPRLCARFDARLSLDRATHFSANPAGLRIQVMTSANA